MRVRDERTHAEILCNGEAVAVVCLGLGEYDPVVFGGDVPEKNGYSL